MKLMDDFSEFQNLVPQAGLRMRLKELTHKYTGTPELVKESLLVANGVESSDHFLQSEKSWQFQKACYNLVLLLTALWKHVIII